MRLTRFHPHQAQSWWSTQERRWVCLHCGRRVQFRGTYCEHRPWYCVFMDVVRWISS